MSNRETFREDPLLKELFKKLQKELHDHEGLKELNQRCYEEKIANAISNDEGINALEELLATDPSLAHLFGSLVAGKVAAKTATNGTGAKITGPPRHFEGTEFPSYFRREDGSTSVQIDFPRGDTTRVSFQTDVKNNYFTRHRHRGKCDFKSGVEPTFHLFNGRLTFTFHIDKSLSEGSKFVTTAEITDDVGHGPFELTITGNVVAPRVAETVRPPEPNPKADVGPSRPDIKEVVEGAEVPPIRIERAPDTGRLLLVVNKGSRLLLKRKVCVQMRKKQLWNSFLRMDWHSSRWVSLMPQRRVKSGRKMRPFAERESSRRPLASRALSFHCV